MATTQLNPSATREFVDGVWTESIVPTLVEYIKIPNKSPLFDPKWQEHGHMDRAVDLLSGWAREHAAPDMTMEVVRLEGRTPLIYMEIPGIGEAADDTVLLYGHLDKQPEMAGWDEDKGPWIPVIENGRLYGRGGADDGYSIFASLTAVNAVHRQGAPHARCVVIIEGCEESGSYDLPHYIDALSDRIGSPTLVVCLDSGCGNYDQLWITTSLRGMVVGDLRIDILREGVHSGDASGIVSSSFRILRQILSRIEDPATGVIVPEDLYVEIPRQRIEQADKVAREMGQKVWDHFPFVDGAGPIDKNNTELTLNRTWRPALAVTGVDGIPAIANAGNVLRPHTAVKLSFRLPPTLDGEEAAVRVKNLLEKDPPYGARVRFENVEGSAGWNAPAVSPWLERSLSRSSLAHFGKDAMYMGEGGSIPFMGMLGEKFPKAQFAITGVLGPGSNAHGPNEFLEIATARRLTCCVADLLVDHATRDRSAE